MFTACGGLEPRQGLNELGRMINIVNEVVCQQGHGPRLFGDYVEQPTRSAKSYEYCDFVAEADTLNVVRVFSGYMPLLECITAQCKIESELKSPESAMEDAFDECCVELKIAYERALAPADGANDSAS